MIRNLIYHIYAVDTAMLWWNLRMINTYLSLFNGKRVFTIANPHTDNVIVDKIVKMLGTNHSYIIFDNSFDTYGGTFPFFEVSGPIVANTNPNEFVFHGHTKGVRYETINPSVLFWTNLMYEYNLARYSNVDEVLTNHDTHGIFKCNGVAFGGRVNWHYPGAFWWARHSSLFSQDWLSVERDACATEILPSQFIPSERAYNGLELPQQFVDIYKPYAADKLYNENCWRSIYNTDDLTPIIEKILYANT